MGKDIVMIYGVHSFLELFESLEMASGKHFENVPHLSVLN
jgi:hypothetical protein